jgi:protein-L-isoaspartate(D-aspartate) O-methyltransferase
MVKTRQADLAEVRKFYATLMAAASRSRDPRLVQIFEEVRREDFMGPGPWKIKAGDTYCETPSADPLYLYQNVLVALDAAKGINNGEPHLHAAWIAAVNPRSGEQICHIGTGTGYYTAILSRLTQPGGRVQAFEIEERLAHKARENLRDYDGVTVVHGDATQQPVPDSDIIYVNAGVVAPPAQWLRALRPRGRMIFPWRPSEKVALAVILLRADDGFWATPVMPAWFIPCVGASQSATTRKVPDGREAWSIQSAWLTEERSPNETAVAIYEDVWFSSERP